MQTVYIFINKKLIVSCSNETVRLKVTETLNSGMPDFFAANSAWGKEYFEKMSFWGILFKLRDGENKDRTSRRLHTKYSSSAKQKITSVLLSVDWVRLDEQSSDDKILVFNYDSALDMHDLIHMSKRLPVKGY